MSWKIKHIQTLYFSAELKIISLYNSEQFHDPNKQNNLFLGLRSSKAKKIRYLWFYILVTRCSTGIRRNRNSFSLHIKRVLKVNFSFQYLSFFSEILCLFSHPCNRERMKKRWAHYVFLTKELLGLRICCSGLLTVWLASIVGVWQLLSVGETFCWSIEVSQ
jgi:hypothetical protein